jgi:hypothetical protein
MIEIMNTVRIMIPNLNNISHSNEIFSLNQDMESLRINNLIFWFQQNSKNAYKLNLNECDWIMTENKDNFVFKEMFRVCMINSEEALITGIFFIYFRRRSGFHLF